MLSANHLCSGRMSYSLRHGATLLALGSNKSSATHDVNASMLKCTHGDNVTNLKCALGLLMSRGLVPIAQSHFYVSQPLGTVRQAVYVNAVVAVECVMPIGSILRQIKQIEREMGRRSGVRWGPRVLDIDIVSHRGQYATGQSLGWVDSVGRATVWRRGQLALPHPEVHRRKFVLKPMCDIMPHWHHPIFNRSAEQLLRCLPRLSQSALRQLPLEPADIVCNFTS